MKNKATIALAGLVLIGAVFSAGSLTRSPRKEAATAPATAIHKSARPAKQAETADIKTRSGIRETQPSCGNEEAENLAAWRNRFETLLQQNGSREAAVNALKTEVDAVFSKWVDEQIAPLATQPAIERYDVLSVMEISVVEGAAAIFEQLGIEGGRHDSVTATALESIAAERQYAETAPDHASRLAMLRLDREREARMEESLSIADEPAKTSARSELENWYESGVAAVFNASLKN